MQTVQLQQRLTDFISRAARPLIVIVGPTASGKTDFSLSLAEKLKAEGRGAEIVNADSRQVYRYLDIGTAKITAAEMCGVPHHLIDVLDPQEDITAAWFKEHAERVIAEIRMRGHIPILVGGSMLYVSAIIDGLDLVAGADPGLREKLERKYDHDGGASMYRKLMELDPETARAFSPNNKPYVIRAMEILETTGEKPSVARTQSAVDHNLFIIGMEWPREELINRINARTVKLFDRGWVEEVRALRERGYTKDPGMLSHGYREIMSYLESGKPSLAKLPELISAKTRQYAKRQMTWWRGDSRIVWVRPGQAWA